jgi:hypothetical protein
MAELILAATAKLLATPTEAEGLTRCKDIVAEAITEAAYGQCLAIKIRIPDIYAEQISKWLAEHGYAVTKEPEEIQDWAFFSVSWGM